MYGIPTEKSEQQGPDKTRNVSTERRTETEEPSAKKNRTSGEANIRETDQSVQSVSGSDLSSSVDWTF